jgi:putative redox protein
MEAKVVWKGRLSFTGTADTGFEIPLGGSHEAGGDEDGFRPIELFGVGLAGCTAMDVISILEKKRQQVTAFEVQVHANRATEHPKVITSAVIEYFISGRAVQEEAVVRAIELSATRYCPAQGMLSKIIPIRLKYHIFEDNPAGEPNRVTSGEYVVPQDTAKGRGKGRRF